MSLLPIDRHPTRRQLWVFGAAWFLLLGVAAVRIWLRHHPLPAAIVAALAVGLPLAGRVDLGLLRRVYVGLSLVTYPLGWLVSWVVLALAYYIVLTPIALVMRLFRHDPLQRTFDRSAATYWSPRPGSPPPESYFRQN
jgi:hypothetical protein